MKWLLCCFWLASSLAFSGWAQPLIRGEDHWLRWNAKYIGKKIVYLTQGWPHTWHLSGLRQEDKDFHASLSIKRQSQEAFFKNITEWLPQPHPVVGPEAGWWGANIVEEYRTDGVLRYFYVKVWPKGGFRDVGCFLYHKGFTINIECSGEKAETFQILRVLSDTFTFELKQHQ